MQKLVYFTGTTKILRIILLGPKACDDEEDTDGHAIAAKHNMTTVTAASIALAIMLVRRSICLVALTADPAQTRYSLSSDPQFSPRGKCGFPYVDYYHEIRDEILISMDEAERAELIDWYNECVTAQGLRLLLIPPDVSFRLTCASASATASALV